MRDFESLNPLSFGTVRLLGLCFLVPVSCASGAPLANLVAGSALAAKQSQQSQQQSQQSQSNAARQNAYAANNAAKDPAEEKRNRDAKDAAAKSSAAQKKVMEARSRANANQKSPDAVDAYAKAVLDSEQVLRHDPDKSFDWKDAATDAGVLSGYLAVGVPGAQKKAHFYAQAGLLFARVDESNGAITAFEASLEQDPTDLAVVESLLGVYQKSDATGGASEALCKRTRHSLKGEVKIFKLYDICVSTHPKFSQYAVPADLAKMLPWASGKELAQYKHSLTASAGSSKKVTLETVTDAAMGYEIKLPKGAKVLQKEEANHSYSLGGLDISLNSLKPDQLANMVRLKKNFNQITVQSEKEVDGGQLIVGAPGDFGIQYVMYSKPGQSTGILATCSGPKAQEALLTEMCSSLKVTK